MTTTNINQYRPKSDRVITAVQWDGDNTALVRTLSPLTIGFTAVDGKLKVHTLEGPIYASVGDFILKSERGEVWPVKPHLFHERYDRIT